MVKRIIKKVAVIGSGIMGSGIACHLANIGVEVLMLDILPKAPNEAQQKKGLDLSHKSVRNTLADTALAKALKSKPAPLYYKKFKDRITTGNLEDDLSKLGEMDWIIEVVVERLDIKKELFKKLDQYRKQGSLISSNTSGIPIRFMSEGRSEDFQNHFCGTHFFNPARYLKLFEIIPGPKTQKSVIDFFSDYGQKYLGKTIVIAKDTPAFIGNRIGIFSIMSLFKTMQETGLHITDIDKLTGTFIGRPKSATFRTVDVVGLDTLAHVARGIQDNCLKDESNAIFKLPEFVDRMLENQWLGSKSGQGFYKKIKTDQGKKQILVLNLENFEYELQSKTNFTTLAQTKTITQVKDRFKILISGKDKASEFYRKNFAALFAYVSHRVGEITDSIYKIDDAMRSGFGWQHGPFEIWDAIGLDKGLELIEQEGLKVSSWVEEMKQAQQNHFYTVCEGKTYYYDVITKAQQLKSGQEGFIILDNIRESKEVFKNSGVSVTDLGDGILNVEFRSKMNTIGGDVLAGVNKAIDLAEKEYQGLVIANQGANFSVGANLAMIFMMAIDQEYDELNMAVKYFQDTCMRLRYSAIPTVVAPHGMTFGGGCEMSLHADKVVAASESYIGLVEFGVGFIPGGGGSKEMALRASDTFMKNDVELNRLQEYFLAIAMAKVSTSAYEAFDTGILQKHKDIIVVNKDMQIAIAKQQAIAMAIQGYTQPIRRKDVKVLGKQALGMFEVGIDSMLAGGYISEHDQKIANKLGYVMAGGDLSSSTLVSEQYLLDLEREAFLSLCCERKTLERIEYMLKKGKPLRN